MEQTKKKRINTRVLKWIAAIVTLLLIAGLIAVAVLGYFRLQGIDAKIAEVADRTTEIERYALFNYGSDAEVIEGETQALSYEIVDTQVKTVQFSTTFNQETQTFQYEPREVLEVTIRITNGTDTLYDNSSQFFATTSDGTLVSDSSFQLQEDEIVGSTSVRLAPNGSGLGVFYYELDGRTFESIFVQDVYYGASPITLEL